MRTIYALVAKDFRIFWNDRMAFVLTFFVPMALITIFGFIFGGGGSPSGIRILVVDEAQSETSAKLIGFLQEEETFRVLTKRTISEEESVPLDREYAASLLKSDAGSYRYLLVFPKDLVDEEFGLNMELLYNPQNTIEYNIVQGILQKTLFARAFPLLLESSDYGLDDELRQSFDLGLAEVISEHFGGDPELILEEIQSDGFWAMSELGSGGEAAGEGSGTDIFSGIFNLELSQVYGKNKNPAAQSVGGWAVMFLLFSLTGAASSLFEERDKGLFFRLLSGPASRAQVLWSKFVFCSSLGLLQMIVLIIFGELLFDIITSAGQILPLLVVSVLTATAATAFGMLLSSIAKTPAQANGLGTLFILGMSAFGGAMMPLFMMPEFIRTFISPFTLVYWAMDGILAVLWRDAALQQILPNLAVLGGISVVVLAFSLWRFRRGDLFR
ncbi:MAG: ABC transporter permease [Puniceicoccaceae bacterium]